MTIQGNETSGPAGPVTRSQTRVITADNSAEAIHNHLPIASEPPLSEPPESEQHTMSDNGNQREENEESSSGKLNIPALKAHQRLKDPSGYTHWTLDMKALFRKAGVYPVMKDLFTLLATNPEKGLTEDQIKKLKKPVDWDDNSKEMDDIIEADAIISASIDSKMSTKVHEVNDPITKWIRLQRACVGSGATQLQNLVHELNTMKSSDHKTAEAFVDAFETTREKLVRLGRKVSDTEYASQFIFAVAEEHPSWANRTRSDIQKAGTVDLDDLQQDFIDECKLLSREKTSLTSEKNNGKGKKKRNRGECPYKDHSAEACWVKDPSKRNNRAKWANVGNPKANKDSKKDSKDVKSDAKKGAELTNLISEDHDLSNSIKVYLY